jgi:chemotaxis protein CheZ
MSESFPFANAPLLPLATPAAATEGLLAKVTVLDRLLAQARADLALIRIHADQASNHPGPGAPGLGANVHQELDEIVRQTAAATDAILDACEAIDPLTASLDQPAAERVQAATARIYQACGIHDLVGQRVQRVLGTLDTIEAALEAILVTLGEPGVAGHAARPTAGAEAADNAAVNDLQLINGPQLPLIAMRQADIDRLMAGD